MENTTFCGLGVWDDLLYFVGEAKQRMDIESAVCQFMSGENSPQSITYQKDGRFHRVISYDFGMGGQASRNRDDQKATA